MTLSKLIFIAILNVATQHKLINSKGFYTVFTTRVKVGDTTYSISNPTQKHDVPGTAVLAKYGWHCNTEPIDWDAASGYAQLVSCTSDTNGLFIATGVVCDANSISSDKSVLLLDRPADKDVTSVIIMVSCNTRSIRSNN